MKKPEECEYFDEDQCNAVIKESTMARDKSCLNVNKFSCCYRCYRRDSCETSCDYLANSEANTTAKTKPGGDCPKCGGEMMEGTASNYTRILKLGDLSGDSVSVLYCRECGFVEFYKEPSTREPWRLQKEQQEQSDKAEQTQPTEETSGGRRKMVR